MKKLKKLIAVITSIIAFSVVTVLPASATTETILLGDVYNTGDGVTVMDALTIQRYLAGLSTATSKQLTAMDVNEDGIIDKTDADYIIRNIGTGGNFLTVTKELYTTLDNSTRKYRKHSCSSTSSSSYTSYTISAATSSINSIQDEPMTLSQTPDNEDNKNIGCVKLSMTDFNGNSYVGSGFVVGENVIATAAHCLYNSSGFMRNINVTIYDENYQILETVNASTIHIPNDYAINGNVNYDYGLIYVNTDLSDYKYDLGVMTDFFTDGNTNERVTASGFTTQKGIYRRYYSSGSLIAMNGNLLPERPYRFHSEAICPPGKSGGVTYFESKALYTTNGNINPITNTSAVGINSTTSGNDCYGMRITPTLLRFYLQNPNLS